MTETVNHPPHYGGDVDHEVWKCLSAWGLTGNAYRWNAIKYLARAGRKGGRREELDDLFKAIWYVTRDIQVQEGLMAEPKGVGQEDERDAALARWIAARLAYARAVAQGLSLNDPWRESHDATEALERVARRVVGE